MKKKKAITAVLPPEHFARQIYFIRGQRVMLDTDLAVIYGILTKNLNKAVQRNIERFPDDFMLQLTEEETENLRFQTGTLKNRIPSVRAESESPQGTSLNFDERLYSGF